MVKLFYDFDDFMTLYSSKYAKQFNDENCTSINVESYQLNVDKFQAKHQIESSDKKKYLYKMHGAEVNRDKLLATVLYLWNNNSIFNLAAKRTFTIHIAIDLSNGKIEVTTINKKIDSY